MGGSDSLCFAVDKSGQSLGCYEELLTDALLLCCEDVCAVPHSFSGELYNNQWQVHPY